MPTAPLRFCRAPGCATRVARGYCEQHAVERRDQQVYQYADSQLYSTHAWRRMRLWFLGGHPYCASCGKLANEVDHVVPHRGDHARFWDCANWQALCKACHSRKTRDEVLTTEPLSSPRIRRTQSTKEQPNGSSGDHHQRRPV